MTQSQNHGFIFENSIRTNVFNLKEETNNTDKYDIPKEKNIINNNENCSIKSTGSGTICCGDILNFYNYDFKNTNTIIVIKYKQTETEKIIVAIYEINYNTDCHALLFGNLPKEVIENYVKNVKSIPRYIKGTEAKQIFDYITEKNKLKKKYNYKITINPKVDGSQSRVQCSITNFEKTLKNYITYKSMSESPNILREKEIISKFKSNKRQRNKKQQTNESKKPKLDKFYTSKKIASKCVDLVNEFITIEEGDLCIEPSAGNGSFMAGIKSYFKDFKFYDIAPDNEEIIKQDYLNLNYNTILHNGKIHIIGNPPFGRQSSLAIKFIKKSSEYADSISFILPKSFKKDSLKKHFPLNFHLIYEYDLPKNSFIVDNEEHDVPCVFQIWIKKDINRILPTKLIPNKYRFVKKNENHDIAFTRVGGNAGNIHKNTLDKCIQAHYFIKFDTELTDKLFHTLKAINYKTKDNTCGPRSISKQEVIKEFNKLF